MDEAMLRQWAVGLEIIPGANPLRNAVLKLLDEKQAVVPEGESIAAGFGAVVRMEKRLAALERVAARPAPLLSVQAEVEKLRREFEKVKAFAVQVNQSMATLEGKARRELAAAKLQVEQGVTERLNERVDGLIRGQEDHLLRMGRRVAALERAAKKAVKKKGGA